MVFLSFVNIFHFVGVIIIQLCIIYDSDLKSLLLPRIKSRSYIYFFDELIRNENSNNEELKQAINELLYILHRVFFPKSLSVPDTLIE